MPETDPNLLAQRLKQLRINTGFTQSEVAGKIGVHKTTIMRWENGGGTHHIKIPVVAALASIFRVSPAYLMGWTDDPLANDVGKLTQELNDARKPEISGYIGENEALLGLRHLLVFYGLSWQKYDDALLYKLLNSDLLRNLFANCLSLLQKEKY